MSPRRAPDVLDRIGPIARTMALRAHGVTTRELARACGSGEIVRVRQGLYAARDAPVELVHAARHGGVPGCLAAGRMLGLWVLGDSTCLHIWLGGGGTDHGCDGPCDVRLHWDDGIAEPGRLPPVRNVLLQIALCAGEEPFFAALESALRKHLLPTADLHWLGSRLPPQLRWLLTFAHADADSGLESLLRLRLHHLGIEVRTQVLIDGVGEVDLLIGDRLLVEADGSQNHDDEAAPGNRHKDLLRDARAAARGYETLRFDYAMIVHDWPTVAAALLAKVAAGAHLR